MPKKLKADKGVGELITLYELSQRIKARPVAIRRWLKEGKFKLGYHYFLTEDTVLFSWQAIIVWLSQPKGDLDDKLRKVRGGINTAISGTAILDRTVTGQA